MNIHEYQAKELLAKYGVAVPRGFVAFSADEAEAVAKKLSGDVFVVKAQIHAGGRGKAGGVKVLKDIGAVKATAASMLGMKLITHQTGPEGRLVQKVYVEEGSKIVKEYYFSIVVDRNTSSIVLVASSEGGVDIEEVAASSPEKITKVIIDSAAGLQSFHIRKLAAGMHFNAAQTKELSKFVQSLYKVFFDTDASQVEINPLIEDAEGKFIALDAKFNFDLNALFKHPEIAVLADPDEQDPLETAAAKFDLNYVKMRGNIGCMVNGAGLAMATMDIIKLYGGEPANFLDVGGGATKEKVAEAFRIITADPGVKGVLINIFGGIMRCEIIAEGVLAAAKELNITLPVVVRLEGTNAERGREMINSSGLAFQAASDLVDATDKIVRAIGVS